MTPEIFVEYSEYALCAILGAQFGYGLLLLILGNLMINNYERGTFEIPSNLFKKIVNFYTGLFFGASYFVYKRLYKYNWFLRKLYFSLYLLGSGILSIIIFYILSFILHFIFKV
ncbi:hypothetical protein CHH92_16605 [Bacillus sonorensis]|uniref:Uncharacterized protein n=2 Tax=Bacillus sonorensis TaxID=119858 RepID=M5P3F1_9BACI|nr:hypothetical protein S101395_04592 [Bacillus sonorensis]EME73963.1 hypothetical protein BSONL12_13391 [Bacillus sonorensis L12]PAD59013.1 hypothetical protein CHH92_16605 [Bacillus sonorensis]RHJ07119.1 hypothetical protein DW143_18855 [Bacillus sonorensis]GIN69123.1 hypothetical protein J41TS2_45440 [Bacillus sonorensis]